MTRHVSLDDLRVDPSSYVDPQGFLFRYEDVLYRCIRPVAAPLFRGLMADGVLARLNRDLGLVEADLADLEIAEQPDGLVVRHPTIGPLTYCVEWSPSMLADAARLTLDLAEDLADRTLMLQDAYPWNVLFSGCDPVFVDLTSIAPQDTAVMWPAHEQFEAFFLRPLTLMGQGKGRAARALLMDNIDGIRLEDFVPLAAGSAPVRMLGVRLARRIERYLQGAPALKQKIHQFAEGATARATPAVRKRFLRRLRRRIDDVLQTVPAGDPWRDYYQDIDASVDKQAKLTAVEDVLRTTTPANVLDLGCNTGVFSLVAARQGARVVSVDASESCIEILYATAKREGLIITPLIANIACPTPPFGFKGSQYDGLWRRVAADTVLCLGLMHHLHINARQSFERIADLLNEVCEKTLIFEFVGMDDANVPLLSRRRPIGYDLDNVVAALRTHFPRINVRDSDRPTRKLLICGK
jgi:SAM-dependent methyltransferase